MSVKLLATLIIASVNTARRIPLSVVLSVNTASKIFLLRFLRFAPMTLLMSANNFGFVILIVSSRMAITFLVKVIFQNQKSGVDTYRSAPLFWSRFDMCCQAVDKLSNFGSSILARNYPSVNSLRNYSSNEKNGCHSRNNFGALPFSPLLSFANVDYITGLVLSQGELSTCQLLWLW